MTVVMALKVLFAGLVALALVGAAFVFDAASKTALAIAVADSARRAPSPAARARYVDQAERDFGAGLAFAAHWHAGAAEALSGLALIRASAEGDVARLKQSAAWAEQAVAEAPVQPHSWARLAVLTELGLSSRACITEQCLTNSWRTGPMIGGETGCSRLRLANRLQKLSASDRRIALYLASGVSNEEAASCLSFLAPDELFALLLRHSR
jgi:hypothetical protein